MQAAERLHCSPSIIYLFISPTQQTQAFVMIGRRGESGKLGKNVRWENANIAPLMKLLVTLINAENLQKLYLQLH